MTNVTEKFRMSYIPEEDVTIVWQDLIVDDECVQTSLVGWYHGEPDDAILEKYYSSHLQNIARYFT